MLNPGWVLRFSPSLLFHMPRPSLLPLTAAAEERSTNGRCPPQSFSWRQSGGTCDNLKCPSCCGERREEVGGFANRSSENRRFSWVRNLQSSTIVQFAHGDSSNYVVRTLAFKTLSSLDPSVSVTQINTFRCGKYRRETNAFHRSKTSNSSSNKKTTTFAATFFLRSQSRKAFFSPRTFSCKCTSQRTPLDKNKKISLPMRPFNSQARI